jgi:hypothetical protein
MELTCRRRVQAAPCLHTLQRIERGFNGAEAARFDARGASCRTVLFDGVVGV